MDAIKPILNHKDNVHLTRRKILGYGLVAGSTVPALGWAMDMPQLYGEVQSLAEAMDRAQQMRTWSLERGDRAYGAVIIRGLEVVGLGGSQVLTDVDPTSHAELLAIRDAARRLGTVDLGDCRLVSTSMPCAMCQTAAYWARIESMIPVQATATPKAPAYPDCA